MSLFRSIEAFFFTKQSATGFVLMRRAWAMVVGIFLLFQWQDVTLFYSDQGLAPLSAADELFRPTYHYTLLSWITAPPVVFALYLFFLGTLLCMAFNVLPRLTTILSVLLLFSFHERNPFVLGGGDTVLRNIGFILVLWSVESLVCDRGGRPETGDRRPGMVAMWLYRLLLWQMIVLYGTSLWYKLLGHSWIAGTAVNIAFHHPVFARWPLPASTDLSPFLSLFGWATLVWEGLWVALLVPKWLTDLLPPALPRIPLKRLLIGIGIVFHAGILLFLDVGSFSLAVLVAYLGLLQEEDLAWIGHLKQKFDWKPMRK